MNVMVVGAGGQLGRALETVCPPDVEMIGLGRSDLDITDEDAVARSFRLHQPTVVINAAAYTAVDLAESDAATAAAVNVEGARIVACAAASGMTRLIHISTDFVFDGCASAPYRPDSPTNPIGVYGRTKRDGEIAVLDEMPAGAVVLRTAWLYGDTGKNFVTTILRLMAERGEVSVVTDELGTPTWAESLADVIWRFCTAPTASGVYHWTDAGQVNRYDFANAIRDEALEIGLLDRDAQVLPITGDQFPTAARRPAYSVLDSTATTEFLKISQVPWRTNLRRMLTRTSH